MPRSLSIRFADHDLTLLPSGAIYWPERQSLVVADVHLGKDATFRQLGIPVPAGNTAKDLDRLTELLRLTEATRLVILGDLVHGRSSHDDHLAAAFGDWRRRHAGLDVLLVRGNHDRSAGATPADWRTDEVDEPFADGGLMLAHHPDVTTEPHLCGHVHPVVPVRDFDGSYVSIPCFVVDSARLLLPAFGSFTGGCKVERAEGKQIYAATASSVVIVK